MNEDNENNTPPKENAVDTESQQTEDTVTESPVESEQSADNGESPVGDVAGTNEVETTQTENPVSAEPTPAPVAPKKSRKKVLIIAAVVLAVVAVGAATWWLLASRNSDEQNATNVSQNMAKLGIAVTVADGTVEFGRDDVWKQLTVDSDEKLVEGDLVRTGADSRAVLTLDDGSAVRLDGQTQVKLASLVASDVQIDQIEGAVYSRVVASDRNYTVNVDDASYEALGTAFATFKRTDRNGLQVFQSSVKASGLEEAVAEGKQYFVANANGDLAGKVTDIDLTTLANDAFVAWNVAEDKKDAKFKEKLGALARYDEVVAGENAKRLAEEEAKRAAEAAAEKARLEAERRAREAAAAAGAMTAKLSDGGISWTYSGNAQYGYKVVYSSTNTTPSFLQNGTTAVYVSDPAARFLTLPNEMKAGITYYVRVCMYEPNNPNGPCQDYSNVVQVKRM